MKSVASIADLTKHAAQLGGSVSVGGRTINAQGAKLTVMRGSRAPQQTQEPAPPAPPPAAPDALWPAIERMGLMLAGAIDGLKEAQARQLPAMLEQPTAAPQEPKPPKLPASWSVEAKAGAELGLLQELVATPNNGGAPVRITITRGRNRHIAGFTIDRGAS